MRYSAPIYLAIGLLGVLPWITRPAEASSFYYELQGGLGQVRSASPFFGTDAPSSGFGPSFNLALAYSFSGGEIPLEFQLGLQSRLSTSSVDNGMTYYGVLAPYPMVRLQLSQFFIGGGVTPVLWRRVATSPGVDSFKMVSGSLSFLSEAGFLWAVTPTFSLGAAAAAQFVSTGGTLSPKPILEATAVLRFYFGFSKKGASASSSSTSNEFKGWRYPFGSDLKD